MKVLNRPMFRYGGPIKEGIMNGIKEPRQRYAEPPGFVVPSDPNKIILNRLLNNENNAAKVFEKVGKSYDQDLNNQAFALPVNTIKKSTVPDDNSIESITLNEDFTTTKRNPETGKLEYVAPPEGLTELQKAKLGKTFIGTKEYRDKVEELEALEKANQAKSASDGTVITQGKSPFAYTADKVIEKKGKLPGDDDPPPATKKERINTILEGLGYDRAQKNALYDAMIKAGQRISRTGLGAENLVSDVIAETSQSYDKPEKLREAANLMDVQQQLKLEQIKESKDTRSPIEKNADYFLESGVAKTTDDAIRMARNLPVTVSETFQTKVKEFGKSEGLVQTAIDLSERGQFGNLEFEGKIDKKYKGKPLSEFLGSPGFKGDGVYTADGKILVIQNGVIKQTINVRGSVEDSLFNFGGED
jgi:hypothetical protein